MKNIKNYILPVVVALLVGLVLGKVFFAKIETKYLAGETVTITKDTCVDSTLLCTLTTKDSMSIYRIIREGFKNKSEKVEPKTESVVDAKPEEVPTTIKKQVKTKYMNNGVTEVWDTLTFIGELVDWKRATKTNEIVEVQEKITTTTAIIEKGQDDSNTETIKYLPVESNKSTGTYLGLVGGLDYNKSLDYTAGLQLAGERAGLVLYTRPKNWKYVGIQLNTKLFKVKK